ncbi:MAG: hypothetical protein J6Y69_09775 [Treponema sp.]|nr:hypothetical protein [Treponema sp.]
MKVLSLLNLKSTLSSCTSSISSPSSLAEKIAQRGIQLAALTDLNTAMNCPAFFVNCSRHSIACLFGMEAWTYDNLKTLILFSDLKLAVDFCSSWYDTLPNTECSKKQYYVDEEGEIIGELKKDLQNRSPVKFETLKKQALNSGGVVAYVKPETELYLDTGNEVLLHEDSTINLKAIEKAFERLQVPQAEPLS